MLNMKKEVGKLKNSNFTVEDPELSGWVDCYFMYKDYLITELLIESGEILNCEDCDELGLYCNGTEEEKDNCHGDSGIFLTGKNKEGTIIHIGCIYNDDLFGIIMEG